MESNKQKQTRKFTNINILTQNDWDSLNEEFFKQSIITDYIKINGGTDYIQQNYDLRMMILPNANFVLVKDQIIPGYKLLKNTKYFSKIKRIFLIGYSHLANKQAIFLSGYNCFETNDPKKFFDIDTAVYNEMQKNEQIKKYCERFEINTYTSTTFVEEGNIIKEQEEDFNESIDDNEFTFDIHLAMLNYLIDEESINKVKIIPIWINLSSVDAKEGLNSLAEFFGTYLKKEENFFIYSTNLTNFGRIYNYFGEGKSENKEYRSKAFLRDPANENKITIYIQYLDNEGLNILKSKDSEQLLKLSNFNYCKELFYTLLNSMRKYDLNREIINYQVRKFENNDEIYESNMVSLSSIIFYNKI